MVLPSLISSFLHIPTLHFLLPKKEKTTTIHPTKNKNTTQQNQAIKEIQKIKVQTTTNQSAKSKPQPTQQNQAIKEIQKIKVQTTTNHSAKIKTTTHPAKSSNQANLKNQGSDTTTHSAKSSQSSQSQKSRFRQPQTPSSVGATPLRNEKQNPKNQSSDNPKKQKVPVHRTETLRVEINEKRMALFYRRF